jgi:multicomponent Na+:H+ antiporter subunit G
MKIVGQVLITAGIIFIIFGYIGIFRFRHFYSRILVSSKADTVGLITIMAGVMLVTDSIFFSLKVLLILLFTVLTTPITTHSIARSAYLSGYKVEKDRDKDDG